MIILINFNDVENDEIDGDKYKIKFKKCNSNTTLSLLLFFIAFALFSCFILFEHVEKVFPHFTHRRFAVFVTPFLQIFKCLFNESFLVNVFTHISHGKLFFGFKTPPQCLSGYPTPLTIHSRSVSYIGEQ